MQMPQPIDTVRSRLRAAGYIHPWPRQQRSGSTKRAGQITTTVYCLNCGHNGMTFEAWVHSEGRDVCPIAVCPQCQHAIEFTPRAATPSGQERSA